MSPAERLVVPFLVAAMSAYLGAAVAAVGRRPGLCRGLFALGWVMNAALVVLNGLACGHPPLGNMYHVMTVLAACFLPAFAFLAWRDRLAHLRGLFAFTAVLPLVGALCMDRDLAWQRPPALQSPWFVPHVLAYMLAYALAFAAFATQLAGLIGRWRGRADGGRMDRAAGGIARLAFPFMTFGLCSGALWAEEAWGAYWSWDPKETWSLLTWTLYAVYLHVRYAPALRRFAVLAHGLGFLALIATFLLVNLLPRLGSVLHSYATQ